jgi:hypothetical protein
MEIQQSNLFVILGVARSGTSVVTRTLKTLGIDLGNKLIPPGEGNPTGFWEDNDIVYKINQCLLDHFQFRWDSVKLFEQENLCSEFCKPIQEMAKDILQKRIKQSNYWGFKDPRTVRILPFWQSIFSTLSLNEHYIIALRNPLCSSYSFGYSRKKELERGLLLWLMHLIPAIQHTHGKKRMVVSYEKIMQNPHHELTRIQHYFNLPVPATDEINQFTQEFLNKQLDHYHYTFNELESHPAAKISPLIPTFYKLLMKLSQDEIHFEDEEFTSTWNQIHEEFKNSSPMFCYINKLLMENRELHRNLHSMQRSPSWKMIYPLRMTEQVIRSIKKRIQSHYAR